MDFNNCSYFVCILLTEDVEDAVVVSVVDAVVVAVVAAVVVGVAGGPGGGPGVGPPGRGRPSRWHSITATTPTSRKTKIWDRIFFNRSGGLFLLQRCKLNSMS